MRSDLDGGGPDVVVGLPSYDLPGKPEAGALLLYSNVAGEHRSNPSRPSRQRLITADDVPGLSSQRGARFGTSPVVLVDDGQDADHCADLLVGAPGQNVAGLAAAGQAYRLQGGDAGIPGVRTVLDERVVPGGAQAGAGFGSAVAAEATSMFAVGAPRRDVGGVADAGRVVRWDYRLDQTPEILVSQLGGPTGAARAGDRFGEVLDLFPTGAGPVLLVGVPRKDVGSRVDAGAVVMQPVVGVASLVTQDSPGAGGAAEAGDRYGAAVDAYATFVVDHPVIMIAIGVPGEDIGRRSDAGLVSFASVDLFTAPGRDVSPVRGQPVTVSQDSSRVPGSAEAGDAFGSAVAVGEFGTDVGGMHLVVGAPGEDLGARRDAGMVTLTRIRHQDGTPLAGSPGAWTQDSPGVPGAAETGDRFGSSVGGAQLTTVEDDEDVVWPILLVTVAGEDIASAPDAGMAHLGVPPGRGSVALVPASRQRGAGVGSVSMQMLIG